MRIIAGQRRGARLVFPKGLDTRPLTDRIKESLFGTLADTVEGARVLDLYAGSGSFGLEALSRGAQHVVFVESAREALRCLRRNLENNGFDTAARVHAGDVWRFVRGCAGGEDAFDVIFIDPPFADVEDGAFAEKIAVAVPCLTRMSRAAGLLIVRIPSKVKTFGPIGGFEQVRNKRYGRSTVLIYRKEDHEV